MKTYKTVNKSNNIPVHKFWIYFFESFSCCMFCWMQTRFLIRNFLRSAKKQKKVQKIDSKLFYGFVILERLFEINVRIQNHRFNKVFWMRQVSKTLANSRESNNQFFEIKEAKNLKKFRSFEEFHAIS